jgi:hypothetical protein
MPLAVNEPNDEIKELRKQWLVLEALSAGTPAMRQGGEAFLPQWPAEDIAAYRARLNTATLFPAYRRTVGVMSGKPFAKPLGLIDAPASIETWAEDIDLQGVSLHVFAQEMFSESFYGLAGILASYPKAGQQFRSKAEQEASGQRPYLVRVLHNQILGWKSELVNGRMRLTQLRLMESIDEDDGPFGVKCVQQVRVLEPGTWQVWREIEKDKWALKEEGATTLDEIPFVPLYGLRKGFMCGQAPLLDLAYLNVKHWQSQSDQDTILHVARVPILAMIGADDQTGLSVGAMSAVKLPIGADLKFIEHSGAAIKAGDDALAALEQQMIQTGAELLVKQPGAKRTATESQTDAEANKSDLQRMAENFEDALDQALYYMAKFASLGDTGGKVKLYADYGTATLSEASAALIKDLHLSGLLSRATAITELQRRGLLSDDIDPEEEIAAVDAEGPPPGAITSPATLGGGADVSTNDNAGG